MNDLYTVVMIIASMALALVTSVRIAYVLSTRWKFNQDPRVFFCIGSGAAAAVAMGFISFAAIKFGGLLFGLAGVFLAVPLVGFVWLFVVGANKAIERILTSLLTRVS